MKELRKEYAAVIHAITEKKVAAQITAAFQTLLGTKHLYQPVTVDLESLTSETGAKDDTAALRQDAEKECRRPWGGHPPGFPMAPRASVVPEISPLLFELQPVRLICASCKREETFKLKLALDLEERGAGYSPRRLSTFAAQTFVLSYQCQSCDGRPDVFMVRREGKKLTLCGRAPAEFIESPSAIPAQVQKLYGQATIAHQTGFTLAALFLLRSVIEQFARATTKSARAKGELKNDTPTRGGDVVSEYMTLQKSAVRDGASLSPIYDALSAAIHEGRQDAAALFEEQKKLVVRHFEMKKLYDQLKPA